MSDLLKDLNRLSTEDLLEEDKAVLDDFWKEIKSLIDSFAGKIIPREVISAILVAIAKLGHAIATARERVAQKQELDEKRAELADLEEKLREETSEDEKERLRDQIATLQRQIDSITAKLEEYRKQLVAECELVTAAVKQIRASMTPRPKMKK
ncbi:hypothetical protein I5U59_04005 [Stenotrophomonas maltophilia]|uniref:DUF5320 domain-containing protein n=1 Tax=Bacteria TaxID=2 RepID=UPI0006AA312C|nr:DUF5320 domain-containing protein [Stenotrophomonas maltophilia]ALA82160.1 hypothetical protein VN11_08800 [Stenotrophomonas maltophilia]MBH1477067.1 hypothetical protein [Stenotrophomonas maltophilia]MBH1502236.1 hypothetical protein [Stenotrophomonas maltophilia]MBH1784420.1 hypothetical protein [Stenotrophomonas maltophilia]